ncbi:iditol 2-dehydrogenase [Marmoricola sp. Leaf446]|uniref:zinc-binding dehydrogenase n=1 Tax=Marmoricola sp. Leaf446 TaxID=1736379 RepID=UPI000700E96D|nr:zinc-binding dehydrogenase [Marmoricola sp. Leaf446]KQT93489.1 iditol 2-dehydrogenase [Marmoricola sp. Leaf446]
MKAAVFLGDKQVALTDVEEPRPGPGEVVVQVCSSGMCGSDLKYYRGPGNDTYASGTITAGHEPAGVVHAVGPGVPDSAAVVGDRVMVHHYIGCGSCAQCRSGWTQMCTRQPVVVLGMNGNGSHAPYLTVPAATLVKLDDRLSFDAGAAIGCGTGTAWGGLRRLGDLGGATVAIFGQGPVGLSGTMLAVALGARVIAVDMAPSRLAQARALGATAVVDPCQDDPVAAIRDLTGGRGAHAVLESSGSSAAASAGLRALGPWGRFCVVGLGGEVRFDVLEFHRSQMTAMTSWSMSLVGQEECAAFVAENAVPVDDLFTHRWSLDEVVEAYELFDRQDAGKGVIQFT